MTVSVAERRLLLEAYPGTRVCALHLWLDAAREVRPEPCLRSEVAGRRVMIHVGHQSDASSQAGERYLAASYRLKRVNLKHAQGEFMQRGTHTISTYRVVLIRDNRHEEMRDIVAPLPAALAPLRMGIRSVDVLGDTSIHHHSEFDTWSLRRYCFPQFALVWYEARTDYALNSQSLHRC